MRKSRVKAKLRQKQPVLLTTLHIPDPQLFELTSLLGFDGIWLEAPPEVLRQRVGARRNDASDADLAVLEKQLRYDLGALDWHRIDASATPDVVAGAALQAIS